MVVQVETDASGHGFHGTYATLPAFVPGLFGKDAAMTGATLTFPTNIWGQTRYVFSSSANPTHAIELWWNPGNAGLACRLFVSSAVEAADEVISVNNAGDLIWTVNWAVWNNVGNQDHTLIVPGAFADHGTHHVFCVMYAPRSASAGFCAPTCIYVDGVRATPLVLMWNNYILGGTNGYPGIGNVQVNPDHVGTYDEFAIYARQITGIAVPGITPEKAAAHYAARNFVYDLYQTTVLADLPGVYWRMSGQVVVS